MLYTENQLSNISLRLRHVDDFSEKAILGSFTFNLFKLRLWNLCFKISWSFIYGVLSFFFSLNLLMPSVFLISSLLIRCFPRMGYKKTVCLIRLRVYDQDVSTWSNETISKLVRFASICPYCHLSKIRREHIIVT